MHPIITIVIYYSECVWDGPVCLKDMIVEMPEEIERIFSDYKMNLVQVRDSGQYMFHNEDVRIVFEISREIFQGNFEKINREYKDRNIKQELIRVIGKITDSSRLMQQKNRRGGREYVYSIKTIGRGMRTKGMERRKKRRT